MEELRNSSPIKRRAACDECRSKKLKCTGERPACSRCARENIACVYSAQKQMGRPKKRARIEEEDIQRQTKETGEAGGWETGGAYDLPAPSFDFAFTPGGSLQPWLQHDSGSHQWMGESGVLDNIPALTPDNSSSNSPSERAGALLDLPPELQASHPAVTSHLQKPPSQPRDSSLHELLDPSLPQSDGDVSLLPNCACLSTLYLTLNTLQSMSPDEKFDCASTPLATVRFPFALHPLREAMQAAYTVISCTECPKRFISGMQNTQLIGTLLVSIAERFHKVLESIDAETQRARIAGEMKKFRLADLNTSTSHLHTGGLGCIAAFNLNMSPDEWKSMAKKVVKAEVLGPEEGNECCCYLTGVIEQMVQRQERFHKDPTLLSKDFPRGKDQQVVGGPRELTGECSGEQREPLCLKMVGFARSIIEGLDWT